jgi:hypothetical protein
MEHCIGRQTGWGSRAFKNSPQAADKAALSTPRDDQSVTENVIPS